MKKLIFHPITDVKYLGIVTILDYEMHLNAYLSEFVIPSCQGKKVLIDLALKSGMDEYRFVEFDVDKDGRIIVGSNKYAKVTEDIRNTADSFLKQECDIVNNSMLTDTQKNFIKERKKQHASIHGIWI